MVQSRKLAVWSFGINKIPNLVNLLEAEIIYKPKKEALGKVDAILCWGHKASSKFAQATALKNRMPLINLEDGFLRSVGVGKSDPPLSLVLDDIGIYYDAARPSRLEMLIAAPKDDAALGRARALAALWRSERLSKYNHARECVDELPPGYVLVADQTHGDASVQYGLADESSFQRMLEAALSENPGCTVVVKTHPEVISGRKKGYFDVNALSSDPRIKVLGKDAHPAGLIEHAKAVYAVTSQMGFEGLLWGKRVRTFGMPFYAGWGLTEDDLAPPERRRPVPLESLVYSALVEYPRYIDPETSERCEPETLMQWMGLQRSMRERFPETVYALGFFPWKRPILRDFFQGSTIRFVKKVEDAPDGATLLLWGRRAVEGGKRLKIIRLEDGFLRSVGLGANLVRPLSWVMDGQGMYYDSTGRSDLEQLLQNTDFDSALIERAGKLRRTIVERGITKYNVGASRWKRPEASKRVILVPGQVECDASIAFGSPSIRRNIDLLRAVREAEKEAYIIYKPHPDVASGLRASGAGEKDASLCCDGVVTDIPMGELLDEVDEVHTMTSQSGFEALLRGKKVVTYGQPFYAGWGLTEDKCPIDGRRRKLTIDELAACALILYPVYVSRTTGRYTTPERAIEELLAWRTQGPSSRPPLRRRLWLKFLEGIKDHVPQFG